MKRQLFVFIQVLALIFCAGCNQSKINAVDESHFDEGGHLKDKSEPFEPKRPNEVKFYVEVSGSMNGFFRANKATGFKTDLWAIMNKYTAEAPDVYILTENGKQGMSMSQDNFRTKMNTGAFVSTKSTSVPKMLRTIIDSLNADEVAVFVSDMRYSPVGDMAPDVLLKQYSTDIRNILCESGKAICLVGATSDFLDKKGNAVTFESPYYYLIIGNGRQVAEVRNTLSELLQKQKHFIDNIESGFDYGRAAYSFDIPNKCVQLDDEPTFTTYEDEEAGDTCTIKLKVDLRNYRWSMRNKYVFKNSFSVEALYGSLVRVGNIDTSADTVAIVELKVSYMPQRTEVLEWTLDLPLTDTKRFAKYFGGAMDEGDVTKSYSVSDFVKGMFSEDGKRKTLEPNYILISKNDN